MSTEIWVITCYGKEIVGVYPDAETAKYEAGNHIRNCPEGAMPWAISVLWYLTDLGVWVSAAGGSWLNHHVRNPYPEEPEEGPEFILRRRSPEDAARYVLDHLGDFKESAQVLALRQVVENLLTELDRARRQVSWLTAELADERIRARAYMVERDEARGFVDTAVNSAIKAARERDLMQSVVEEAKVWHKATMSSATGWAKARLDFIAVIDAYLEQTHHG